jgi:hypothetical protein
VVKVVEVMTVVEDKELSIKEKKKFERKKFREYSLNVERQWLLKTRKILKKTLSVPFDLEVHWTSTDNRKPPQVSKSKKYRFSPSISQVRKWFTTIFRYHEDFQCFESDYKTIWLGLNQQNC